MARMRRIATVAALSLAIAGCVPQEKYNALKLDRDRLAEQLGKSQAELDTARAEAEVYKNQVGAIMNNTGSKEAIIANLSAENSELKKQLDEINRRYAGAIDLVGKTGPALPQPLTNELSAFAAQNPDLVEFDATRGIVKFKSDVTFAVGDAELTPSAKTAISRFATILASPAASGYELMVAGHTDSTPVNNPQTIAKGHKNNWYLSAHRAISVGSELLGHKIQANRIAVAGYADQRPTAPNSSESGRAANRRVEVLILPTSVRGPAVASPRTSKPAAAPAAAAPAPKPVMNKDTATIGPSMNK